MEASCKPAIASPFVVYRPIEGSSEKSQNRMDILRVSEIVR
jgi:hypothetical protein